MLAAYDAVEVGKVKFIEPSGYRCAPQAFYNVTSIKNADINVITSISAFFYLVEATKRGSYPKTPASLLFPSLLLMLSFNFRSAGTTMSASKLFSYT